MLPCACIDLQSPIAEFAAEFLSAENNTDFRIIKWNQHSNKWLACYLKWIILVISKLLVITDGRRFCNSKETDNNNKYIIHVGSHFSLCSTARQPTLFVISRILDPSVGELQRLFHACEFELSCLDMCINTKKSCCIRIGPRCDLKICQHINHKGS